MRINENTVIVGENVILLPYEAIHVDKYHSWMKSAEIQRLTASEPLSLDEEYSMQKSWREDDDKLTFIVADKQAWNSYNFQSTTPDEGPDSILTDNEAKQRELDCIVGDVNLFLNSDSTENSAEIEIMIADMQSRKKGYATEALKLMMAYGLEYLNTKSFTAKIGYENIPSINLFTNKLGFSEVSRSEVFSEVTLMIVFDSSILVKDVVVNILKISNNHKMTRKYNEFRKQKTQTHGTIV